MLDEEVEDGVERAQVCRGDRDEEDGHGRSLNEGLAVGPLDLLELRPTRDEESDDGAATTLRRGLLGSAAALGLLRPGSLLALLLLASAPADARSGLLRLVGAADVGAGGSG